MPFLLSAGRHAKRYYEFPPPQQPVVEVWPDHSPGYDPVVPGLGGYGMDTPGGTGRHLATPATKIYLIDDLADADTISLRPELGVNVWSGTKEGCWRAQTNSTTEGKIVGPITSGWTVARKSIPGQEGTAGGATGGYFSYWGHMAPSPGYFLRGCRPSINGMSNVVIMGMRSYMGDDVAGLGANSRDCFVSGYAGGTASHVVLIGNEFYWGIDEIIDFNRPHNAVSLAYNIFGDPLHDSIIEHPGDPTDTDHGFGPIMGGDTTQPGTLSDFRNVYVNITDRAPATTATDFCSANNLYYNTGGRPGGGNGFAIHIWSQFTTLPMRANILHNWFMRGPEHTSSIVAVRVQSGAPVGTVGYLEGNAVRGWTAASQASLVSSGMSGWQQAFLTSAIPSSWGGINGVYRHTPTTDAEWHALVNLMDQSCGSQPGLRSATYGQAHRSFTQMRGRIDGGSTAFQYINRVSDTVSSGDGWFPVPTTVINPLDPGAAWDFDPMPLGSDRNDILGTGTFANGKSMAGKTRLEAWYLRRYYATGGK